MSGRTRKRLKASSDIAQAPAVCGATASVTTCPLLQDLPQEVLAAILRKTGQLVLFRRVCSSFARAIDSGISRLALGSQAWASSSSFYRTTVEHLGGLTRYPGLRRLNLYEMPSDSLEHLPELRNLNQLVLGQCDLTSKALRRLQSLTGLTYLSLIVTSTSPLSPAAVGVLKGLPHLTSLALECKSGRGDYLLQALSKLTRLNTLSLGLREPLQIPQGAAYAWLSRLNTLALDGLEQWEAIQGGTLEALQPHLGGLQRLTLSFQELKGSQLKLLAQLPCRLDLDVSAICPLEFGSHTLAGLVSLVAYRWGDFVHGPAWPGWNSLGFSRYTDLESLDFHEAAEEPLLTACAALPRLRRLGLHGGLSRALDVRTPPPEASQIEQLSAFTRLRTLVLLVSPPQHAERITRAVSTLTSLTELRLTCDPEGLAFMDQSGGAVGSYLRALNVPIRVRTCRRLSYARSSGGRPRDNINSLKGLLGIDNLLALRLATKKISSSALQDLGKMSTLQALSIAQSSGPLPDKIPLLLGKMSSLTCLCIAKEALTPKGFAQLESVQKDWCLTVDNCFDIENGWY